jgi:sulfate adenylyltransferase subunit 1 (EFTu-like GTPase family)
LNRELLAIALTVLAALGLLGLGYEYGTEKYGQQLEICRRLATQQTERANRLAALNHQLEIRVAELTKLNTASPPEVVKADLPADDQPNRRTLTLHRGRAVIIKDGELILALEDSSNNPKRVAINVKTLAGKSQTVVLGAGSSVVIKLGSRRVNLVVKEIHASSATVRLLGI